MTDGPKYMLDADVLMTAARSYYAFEVAPGFWEGLVREASNGRLLSIDRVKEEIQRGNDELVRWANGTFHQWFASTDQDEIVAAYQEIIHWVHTQSQFFDSAKAEFARAADGWLVAYAKARGCMVVTNEKFDPKIRRRIKLPNICQAFGIRYVDTFEMLRALEIRLG